MDNLDASAVAAICETVAFLGFFKELTDPRQQAKVLYPLKEILLLCLIAVLSGADSFVEIATYGKNKLDFLRRFLPFSNGTPSHDQIGDIFSAIDAEQFQNCFTFWVVSLTGASPDVIAIDGKTSRRSGCKAIGKAAIHTVSAFAARQRLVLGQTKVDDKSNEIVAIPKLLDMIEIEGATVTIDAMGCQREIAKKIIDKKADYILALKGNQGSLHEDISMFVSEQKSKNFQDTTISVIQSLEKDHGRIEKRDVTVIHDVDWIQARHQWPGLKSIIIIDSEREQRGKTEKETRLYISSSCKKANELGNDTRSHWSVENSLHWVLDVNFGDDDCRVRTGHAATNFTTIKHIACNLLDKARKTRKSLSMRVARKLASWNDDFLMEVIAIS